MLFRSAPARYQDCLTVLTTIEQVKPVRIIFRQKACRNDEVLAEALITLGCIGPNFKPKAIPAEIKKLFIEATQ